MSKRRLVTLLTTVLFIIITVISYYRQPKPLPSQSLVVEITDGDTFKVATGEKVRMIGMDTPELHHPTKGVQCFGEEAKEKTEQLLLNKIVQLEKDVSETDQYGRLLRYVYLGDELINKTLVSEGFAHAATFPPDVAFQTEMQEAEEEARKLERGLWNPNNCPLGNESATITQPASASNTPPEGCVIKGNISTTTHEKLYHLPSCSSYKETQINTSKDERYFCSESEAQAAGWRKATTCP